MHLPAFPYVTSPFHALVVPTLLCLALLLSGQPHPADHPQATSRSFIPWPSVKASSACSPPLHPQEMLPLINTTHSASHCLYNQYRSLHAPPHSNPVSARVPDPQIPLRGFACLNSPYFSRKSGLARWDTQPPPPPLLMALFPLSRTPSHPPLLHEPLTLHTHTQTSIIQGTCTHLPDK